PGLRGGGDDGPRRRARTARGPRARQSRHEHEPALQVRPQPQHGPAPGDHRAQADGLPAAGRRREQELRDRARGLLLRLPDALPRVRTAVPRVVPARRRVGGGDGAAADHDAPEGRADLSAERTAVAADVRRTTSVAGTEALAAAFAPALRAGDVVVL